MAAGYVPDQMLTEILVRLPVLSLLRCKSVCKQWLSIISNPYFINSQLQRAIMASRKTPTLLSILTEDEHVAPRIHLDKGRQRELSDKAFLDTDGQDSPINFDRLIIPPLFYHERGADPGISLRISHNGIICVCENDCDYLWNPSIRRCMKLPALEEFDLLIGFWYDLISNDYKVLKTAKYEYHDIPKFRVYSTNAGCWREFHNPILKNWTSALIRMNAVVNGVMYFADHKDLVAFDLNAEVIRLVPFPRSRTVMSNVMDFEGSVAMVFRCASGIYLYALDDACGELSWTKKFSIETKFNKEIWLRSYVGAGQFYGRKFTYNFLYDYKTGQTKYYRLGNDKDYATLKYIETLVSLDGFEQME